jgi:hypothetical protein
MPYIDYFLTTDTDLTKEMISEGLPRELTPTLELGKDKRTWNKSQLEALKLLLCNIVKQGHKDNGLFLYSRSHTQIPLKFNPHEISYSSLIAVIDRLIDAGILEGIKAQPRTKGNNPKKLSDFQVTRQILDFAISLGINHLVVNNTSKHHVRLRDRATNQLLDFKHEDYTKHIEMLMAQYCHYLNQHDFLIGEQYIEDEAQIKNLYGKMGKPIHLFRNYRNWNRYEYYQEELDKLFITTNNPNFSLGGRSGGFWQGAKKEDRRVILIDGKESGKVDFPCCHINLCYLSATGNWYQTETYQDLKEEGRELEDAYSLVPDLHRDIPKQMVMIMLNVKDRNSVSRIFNQWLKGQNAEASRNATPEQAVAYKKSGYSNIDIMNMIETKHQPIIDFFYKGKLAGQIIQWEEANLIHHLAFSFIQQYNFPVYTVYDELIVPKEEEAMVKEFVYSMEDCEICKKYSLMSQIKHF